MKVTGNMFRFFKFRESFRLPVLSLPDPDLTCRDFPMKIKFFQTKSWDLRPPYPRFCYVPPPPTGRPRGGSLRAIFSYWIAFPAPRVRENLPAPPCPARGPDAGSHHNSGCLFHYLTSGIMSRKNHRTFSGPAVPKRGPEPALPDNHWTLQKFSKVLG